VPSDAMISLEGNSQPMEALEKANRIRIQRAQLKKDLKSGKARIAEILREPPDFVLSMKVFDLIRAMPWTGPQRASQLLKKYYINDTKTIGGMSERQRQALLDHFSGADHN
jgi:hypothetical protein